MKHWIRMKYHFKILYYAGMRHSYIDIMSHVCSKTESKSIIQNCFNESYQSHHNINLYDNTELYDVYVSLQILVFSYTKR